MVMDIINSQILKMTLWRRCIIVVMDGDLRGVVWHFLVAGLN